MSLVEKNGTQSTVPSSETRCFTHLGVHLSVGTCFQKWPYSSFCLGATPFTIVGVKGDTDVSSQEKDEIYDIYSAEGPCENNFCTFDGAGEHAR